MADIKTVVMLIDHAKQRVDQLLKQLSVVQQALIKEQEKVTALEAYKQEYWSKSRVERQAYFDAQKQANLSRFIHKIDHAIMVQQSVIAAANERLHVAQQAYQESQHRLKRFELLLEKNQGRENQRMQKREQRDLDEMVTRMLSHPSAINGIRS